jgi:hypothetical protein
VLRDGHWQLLETVPAWEGNPTHDGYVVAGWSVEDGAPLGWLVAVNVSDVQAQARVRLEHLLPEAEVLVLTDRMHPGTEYDRDVADIAAHGLFLDLGPHGYNVFEVS